ncbi:prenyltransferase/squalene oxidase repeat-containing protein [Thermogutta sp.]|uniref:prenyltransferase/squalene oxidase repeat-containing protein n=1 Tax=Thermogutta sp. TaxID=1962930 RepID=UPI003C7A4AEA
MSIRLWLRLADCWRCGASVELTEEQEAEAIRLLQLWEAERLQQMEQAARSIQPSLRSSRTEQAAKSPASPRWTAEVPKSTGLPISSSSRQVQVEERRELLRQAVAPRRVRSIWRVIWEDAPAWLISLVFHLVAFLLLGMLTAPGRLPPPAITLSTSINYRDSPGEEGLLEEREHLPNEFEEAGLVTDVQLPADEDVGIVNQFAPDTLGESLQPTLPMAAIADRLSDVLFSRPVAAIFAGRDPSVRSQLLAEHGGTNETEAAVARGLRWLAKHQNTDGSWSLHAFHLAPGASGDEDGLGQQADVAATALALLPFLGAGQTHIQGEYRHVVLKGLNWLVSHQGLDGDLRGNGIGDMYAHGQATLVLCEAYAMTQDPQLREPAQKAIDFIIRAQHPAGGWRYDPGQEGDTSVLGWQLMALRSGKMAYLRVPDSVFYKAAQYLNSAQTDQYGGRYAYLPGHAATPTMTAEALLCRQYLGWPREHRGMKAGAYYLLENLPSPKKLDTSQPWFYYIYYATQVMHNMGGDFWRKWNEAMKATLLPTQRKTGSLAGSWDPTERYGRHGGRIYTTALAICTLEVYYRHMPLYDPLPILAQNLQPASSNPKQAASPNQSSPAHNTP